MRSMTDEGAPAGRGDTPGPKRAALKKFAREMRSEPTPAEAALWKILRDRRFNGFKFRRQTPIGGYIADFVCFEKRLIVEADGSQHGDSETDRARDAWFAAQGFRVRRFWNGAIFEDRGMVRDTIWAELAGEFG